MILIRNTMTIILSGCGGWYDVMCVIPSYYDLPGSKVIVSLSFTQKTLLEKQHK